MINTNIVKKIFTIVIILATILIISNIFSLNSYEKTPEEPYQINFFEINDFNGISHNFSELTGFITDPYNVLIIPFTLTDNNLNEKVNIIKYLQENLKEYNIRFLMSLRGSESSRKVRDFIQEYSINYNLWNDKYSKIYFNLTSGGEYDGNSMFLLAKDRKIHYYYPFNDITDKESLSNTIIKRINDLDSIKLNRKELEGNKFDIMVMGNSSGDFSVCNCPTQPYGGLARYAYILDEYRREFENNPVSLLVGNVLDENSKPDYHNYYLKAISELKLSAITPAISDFSESPHFLKKFLGILPYTSVNINKEILPFSPYEIIETNNIKVGVLGLIPEKVIREYLHLPYDFLVDDYETLINDYIEEIKERTDIIILSGYFDDAYQIENQFQSYPDIDFVINSNSKKISIVPSSINRYRVPIIEVGNSGEFVLKITIDISNNQPKSISVENTLLDKNIFEHGEFMKYYYQYQKNFDM